MTSSEMRNNLLFMRNNFTAVGKWGIPLIKKQNINTENIELIAYSNTRANDSGKNKKCGVHFFVDDYRFNSIYNNPKKSLDKLSQYAFLLTPDFSAYCDMDLWRQIESVAHNRWCGAYWQSKGLKVYPTITWSTACSFDFCFDGVEKNSIVAVGTVGCKGNKVGFMRGYNAMLEKIQPEKIICYGKPFAEMEGSIIKVDYYYNKEEAC